MASIVYINGRYLPRQQATISVFDRGHQFADGVYEVLWVANQHLCDKQLHYVRLEKSLQAIGLSIPWSRSMLELLIESVMKKNALKDGFVYLQINRGHNYHRNHLPSDDSTRPSLFIAATHQAPPPCAHPNPIQVITLPDERWQHGNIKSIALIKAVMSKRQAQEHHASEAWFFDKETHAITEGAASNAWLIDQKGCIRTHRADHRILHGIARHVTIDLCRRHKLAIEEKAFTLADIKTAREAFLTSTTLFVTPISHIDGLVIGNGKMGAVTQKLYQSYRSRWYPHGA